MYVLKTGSKIEVARKELIEAGATLEKREDHYGETKSIHQPDGVYLGKATDSVNALHALRGE